MCAQLASKPTLFSQTGDKITADLATIALISVCSHGCRRRRGVFVFRRPMAGARSFGGVCVLQRARPHERTTPEEILPMLLHLQQGASFARRDLLLQLQAAAQKQWEDEKLFHAEPPAPGAFVCSRRFMCWHHAGSAPAAVAATALFCASARARRQQEIGSPRAPTFLPSTHKQASPAPRASSSATSPTPT